LSAGFAWSLFGWNHARGCSAIVVTLLYFIVNKILPSPSSKESEIITELTKTGAPFTVSVLITPTVSLPPAHQRKLPGKGITGEMQQDREARKGFSRESSFFHTKFRAGTGLL
jgi:hypothetical protein